VKGQPIRYIFGHHGPKSTVPPLEERFWSRVNREGNCWEWLGRRTPEGYGTISHKGRPVGAHVVSFTLHKGPIPRGLVIDHLCRNRWCVNPDHLEAVTNRENVLRGNSPSAVIRRTGICGQGHRIEGDNAYTPPSRPTQRTCKTCMRNRTKAYRAASKKESK
jgi:hypothetical protein